MKRRAFLGAAAGAVSCAKRKRQPNVVFILTDDQRWDCLSAAGHPFLKTPNMDRIANEGARFANAFVTTSLCSPSRASFMSGQYAHTHGVINNFTEYPPGLLSFPAALQQTGYESAYIGKWHMGENNDEKRPGFDYWISHKGQGKYNDTEFNINGKREVVKGYYTHVVTDFAVNYLKRPRNKPFVLCVGQKAPHGVWIPEPKYEHAYDGLDVKKPATAYETGPDMPAFVRERIKTWHGIDGNLYGLNDFGKFIRTYHETILSVDDAVGRIYEALRETGELDNTVLVFAGDNGFLLGEHASIDKRVMWEESIRIPLLVRYPEAIRTPQVPRQMVLNLDVAPSVLDWAGVAPLPKAQGQSFRAIAEGKDVRGRASWMYEYNFEKEFPYTPNVRGVRTNDWKYVHYPNGDASPDTYLAELYHVSDDPQERRNLIREAGSGEKLQELRAELHRLQQETGALPDQMPVHPQLRMELPDAKIR
ncbi:MAG: sulfatase [Acidobacteriota bacterium]